jgi:phenylalanyl-tRNA synthetase alpha chain
MDKVEEIRKQFSTEIEAVSDASSLENLEIKYLGRNGLVNDLFKNIKEVPNEQKKEYGAKLNELKNAVTSQIQEKKQTAVKVQASVEKDTSLPGILPKIGHLHPTTEVIRKLNSFFRYLGYSVYEGPEIETDEYCFEKLNLPKDHPAREMTDTLYIHEPEYMLRVHTSSVETRCMTNETLPVRIVVPGKVYRNENSNATNNAMFYQYEGLVVDKGINMGHLKGTLDAFAKFLYGEDVKTRFRCKYYPQVEPGAGLDIQCTFCKGSGCPVCKYRGYIEVLGSGMVHPNVLKACGIDSAEYSGFAFGMGLDRLVMTQYGINDIRKLYSGEVVFND